MPNVDKQPRARLREGARNMNTFTAEQYERMPPKRRRRWLKRMRKWGWSACPAAECWMSSRSYLRYTKDTLTYSYYKGGWAQWMTL